MLSLRGDPQIERCVNSMNLRKSAALLCAAAMLFHMSLPVSAAGYGQGKARDAENRPTGALEFEAQFGQYDAYALTPDASRIILTFDQGYENGFTPKILDTLRDKQVTAMFFVTGDYAKREPELMRRMIAEGHIIGNHGMTHAKLPSLNSAARREEISALHDYVLSQYGYEMQYLRPPCGEYDAASLKDVQEMGYRTVFWSFAYVDWNPEDQPDPNAALAAMTDAAHGGAIYLLHAVSATNAQVLGDLIDALRQKGYTV